MIHTKVLVSFTSDSEGSVLDLFPTGRYKSLFNKSFLESILCSHLNEKKFKKILKQINHVHLKIVRILFPLDDINIFSYLCGMKVEGTFFFTLTFNNKVLIPLFYEELEKYRFKLISEFRNNITHGEKRLADVVETDLKIYEELKTAIEDLTVSQGKLIEKNVELQNLNEKNIRIIEDLEKSESKRKSLLDNIDEAIIITDGFGNILEYNQKFLEIFEADPDYMESKKIWDIKLRFIPNASVYNKISDLKTTFERYYHSKVDLFKNKPIETMLIMPSGKTKNIEESIFKFQANEDTFIGFCFKDITCKKQLENELEMIHQNEYTKTLLRGLAHNFNTRFQCIIGNISMAMSSIDSEHKSHILLKNAIESFPKINELAKQVAVISEEGEYILTVQKPDQIFREILTENNDKNYKIIIDDFEFPSINCNAYQLKVALMNIIINAKESMPGGGTIGISFGIQKYGTPENSGQSEEASYLCIKISDSGIGIPAENLNRIFDPFFTTNIAKRKGIGLTVARIIIRKHIGFIEVESEIGSGSAFSIFLPVCF